MRGIAEHRRQPRSAPAVERLQAITTEQLIAEGLQTRLREHDAECDLQHKWKELWVSLNGQESWDANPWVWAVEFKRIEA